MSSQNFNDSAGNWVRPYLKAVICRNQYVMAETDKSQAHFYSLYTKYYGKYIQERWWNSPNGI